MRNNLKNIIPYLITIYFTSTNTYGIESSPDRLPFNWGSLQPAIDKQNKEKRELKIICVSNLQTGFIKDKLTGKWESADFGDQHRYLISWDKTDDSGFMVKYVGSKEPVPEYRCGKTLYHGNTLACEGFFSNMKINTESMRYFVSSDGASYISQDSGTPYIEIGECSKI